MNLFDLIKELNAIDGVGTVVVVIFLNKVDIRISYMDQRLNTINEINTWILMLDDDGTILPTDAEAVLDGAKRWIGVTDGSDTG
jgi:hypothetical protein